MEQNTIEFSTGVAYMGLSLPAKLRLEHRANWLHHGTFDDNHHKWPQLATYNWRTANLVEVERSTLAGTLFYPMKMTGSLAAWLQWP